MSSLGEVQRIIALSLNKIQMGRNQRGGLPLHKNLLVATVLNKARDVYMQETMYMNYRQLMACGQFNQEEHDDIEDDDMPETEDYEEDSESDVEDENDHSNPCLSSNSVPLVAGVPASTLADTGESCALAASPRPTPGPQDTSKPPMEEASENSSKDEGFIDESDCDCDARNFHSGATEARVPFQYCFNCAPFHPSNGRGPTLVNPSPMQATPSPLSGNAQGDNCRHQNTTCQDPEDKVLIYDLDSKSTRINPTIKRKRQVSSEETEDAVNSILPKKRRDSQCSEAESQNLDDSGYQEDEKVFHPAFRGQGHPNGMEVDQITSLVSIFSFGQQLFTGSPGDQTIPQSKCQTPGPNICTTRTSSSDSSKEEDDSDSDSDTSSDSGHSSDDPEANVLEKGDKEDDILRIKEDHAKRCSTEESVSPDLEACPVGSLVTAAV